MKILVVIAHYFGPSHPENNLPAIGSYIEPLGRIAAVNETIVTLHGQFGPNRHTLERDAIPADAAVAARRVDIVVVTMRGHNLLAELGLAAGAFEVEYVEGKAPWIAFHAQRLLRDRLGSYDFYCFMEDDLVIRDPAFFDKLTWFQRTFGPGTLLAPVRYEISSTGTPAKVIVDPKLPDHMMAPFRRPNQREEIEGAWNGRSQKFRLPLNPHAGSFFLTQEQMAHWVKQPSFDDRDASWSGPLESAGTLSVGKVFDIYKPTLPDPFFLDIHHYGTRYASQAAPPGQRYGEPPLLAIAQNALRASIGRGEDKPETDESFSGLVERWLAQGTAVEHQASIDRLSDASRQQQEQIEQQRDEAERQRGELDDLHKRLAAANTESKRQRSDLGNLREQLAAANDEAERQRGQITDQRRSIAGLILERDRIATRLAAEKAAWQIRSNSPRWLLGTFRAAVLRRWIRR